MNPEVYWLVMRYFEPATVKLELKEDLHPNPERHMKVSVKSLADEHLADVQVRCRVVCVWCCVLVRCNVSWGWWMAWVR